MRYYIPVSARWLLAILWIFVGLTRVGSYVTESGGIPLRDYSGDPPFATIVDFVDSDKKDYQRLNYGFSNEVRQWEDWLAAVNFEWDEIACVTTPDGRKLEGMLFLEYHEVRFPWAARRIAREYWLKDRGEKGYEKLRVPEIRGDLCFAYLDNIHTPTVVICAGNQVIRAAFRTYEGSESLPLETWAGILAESLQ